MEKWGGG
ncbi:MGF_110-13L [African swine fever virus]